jgi:hypothetical protein
MKKNIQRKYSYIINKKKETSENNKENTNSSLGSDLDEIDDIFFDGNLLSNNNVEEANVKKTNISQYYEAHVICKCGHHFKNDNLSEIFFLTEEEVVAFSLKSDIKCPSCNLELDIVNSIKLETPYSIGNVFRKKFFLFEEEKKIRLVLFKERIQYNKKGKVFIQKERKSITFNTEEKTFFYSENHSHLKNGHVIGISNRNFYNVFFNFFNETQDDKVCFNLKNVQNVFRNYDLDVINPLNRFMGILIENLEKKDVDRVITYIDFINYNNFDFRLREKNLNLISFLNKSKISHYDIKQKNNNIITGYVDSLSIIASIVQYPYNSNILFIKGKEFFVEILKNNILSLPNNSYLKKEKPTSPTDILIEAFNFKNIYELYYNKKHLKSAIRNDYPDLILNNSNIEKLKNLEETKHKENSNSNFLYVSSNPVLTFITAIEWLKNDLNQNKNKIFLPKVAFNTIHSWDDLSFFISMSKYIDKEQILYLCNKFELNDFIFIFKRLVNIYNYERINENIFYNFETKIQIVKYIFKTVKKENLELEKFPYHSMIDILKFLNELYGEDIRKNIKDIFKCQNIHEIIELHDSLYKKVLIKNNKDNDEKIRNFCDNFKEIKYTVVGNVSFKLIDNIDDLLEEGYFMKHCVGTYATQLAKGKHLIFSVKDLDTEERATLEFYDMGNNGFPRENTNGRSFVWCFNQLKSKHNGKASKNIIEKFKIFNKKLQKSGLQTKINENSYDLLIEEKKELITENEQLILNGFNNDDDILPF